MTRRELKHVLLHLRFPHHPKNQKKVKKASRRLRTIAGILVRELLRKLPASELAIERERFALYERVLKQKRSDKNKVYSLHEPHVYCMGKGKVYKKYEFGVKASIAKTKVSNLIVGAMAFPKNTYDTHTLPSVLAQVKRIAKWIPQVGLCDRCYRGKKQLGETTIMIPSSAPKKSDTAYQKIKQRRRFRK